MATADTDKKEIQSFIESLLDPKPIDSLETLGEIKVLLYDSPSNPPKEIHLRSMYPFMTILDLKLAIYDALKMDERALPDFLFLGKQILPGNKITAIEYNWSLSENPTQPVTLFEPLRLSSKLPIDGRFVEMSGSRQNVGLTETDRVTLEDKFINVIGKVPVLRAYMYSTLLNTITNNGPKPVSELDWNGRLYPYFPKLSVGNDVPTEQQKRTAQKLLKGFIRKRQFFMKLNAIMTGGDPIYYIGLKGVLSMLLTFTRPEKISGIETVFYTVPVNDRRPYMRLLPVEGEPISKVHMIGDRPNIRDPNILHQWSQDHTPTPERDFALVKIMIRKGVGNVRPLYCTMRLYDDGTSDITVEPPKGETKLDPDADLEALPDGIVSALQGFPYIRQMPVLTSGKFVFDINLKDIVLTKYTGESLRQKLPIFSAIFQEIQPIPGENPTIMLRYKLVTNFYREDRIQAFITQVQTRKSSKGESFISDLPDLVAEEFQISKDKARTYVERKLQGASDIIMTNPETREYALNNNPGIDIAIFAEKHPIYSFKVYNVNSYGNLQRIITFLSLLMSRPEQEFKVPLEHAEDIKSAEEAPEEEAPEEEAPEEEAPEEAPEEENAFENVSEEKVSKEKVSEEKVSEENAFENVSPKVPSFEEEGPDTLPDYLLDFANEGLTLQEAYAEEEARSSSKRQGAALPELGEAVELEEEHKTLNDFKKEIAQETRESLFAPEPSKKFKVTRVQEPPKQPLKEDEIRAKGLEKYFSDRLKDADKRLFDFKQSEGSAKTKYVVQCASNLMRQPAVLNEGEFQRMKDEYKDVLDSGDITFFLFPLDKDKKKAGYNPDPKKEHYNIMRYGSSPKVQNYYICCKFFCIRDVIMVREKEFLGTKLRRPVKQSDGTMRTTKEPNTCPFCEGLLVKNKRFPGTNEVVLERKPNTGAGRHLYIRFLKKTNHPEGLYLPCCFLEDQPIRIGQHPAYPEPSEDIYSAIAPPEIADEDEEVKEETTVLDETTVLEKITVSYETTLLTARTASIVGSEKLPLDPAMKMLRKTLRKDKATGKYIDLEESGKALAPVITPPQIGLLPPLLNEYFQQQTTDIVSRTFNPQKLTPGSRGFLRVGVQNGQHYRNDSFLAATAIYFFKMDSVQEFKDLLLDIIQPRVFLALNYGNLALEMYDPMWIPRTIYENPRGVPARREQIKNWAYDFLRIKRLTQKNYDLVYRAFLAYDKFRWWLSSDKTKKEYRHFAHLFSLPGLMNVGKRSYAMDSSKLSQYRRPGVIFIILDILQSGELKVRCPAYPVQNEVFATSDIGFLFHHYSGIWEPVFYYDNKALLDGELNQSYLTFSGWKEEGLTEEKFPPIIRRRIDEFRSQCSSKAGGLGIYTSSAGIKSTRIAPLSAIKKILGGNPQVQMYGFIRDSYNHISALVFKADFTAGGLVAVPVIDDGLSFIDLEYKLIMDWDDYEPATIEQVFIFYKKFVEPLFPAIYTIQSAVSIKSTGRIEAIQLSNGLYIPVAHTQEVPSTMVFPDTESPRVIDEMEWSINKKIVIDSTSSHEELEATSKLRLKEFNESFEYLRITFSNWLNSHEDGGNFRNELEEVIFSRDYALFEKRKRLEIKLGPVVEDWIAEKDEDAPRQISILRKDCTLLSEDDCGGMCSWLGEKEKCLIHVAKKSPNSKDDSVQAPGGQILLKRLIEELLRFGNRRKQIFNKTVSEIATLDVPVRENDQYIIPEKSHVWTEMLRQDWSKPEEDAPRYLEEMSRGPSSNSTASELAPLSEETTLPASIATILNPSNSDVVFPRLRLYPSPTGTLEPFLALMKTSPEAIGFDTTLTNSITKLDDKTIRNLIRVVQIPIMQINLQESTPQILSRRPPRDRFRKYAILVIKEDGIPSIVVTDPEAPALLESADLTEETKKIFEDKVRTKVIFVAGQF